MALTYHPFENVSEIEELGQELRRNVPGEERIISALIGVKMIAGALSRGGLAKWAMLAVGASLFRRGWTGHCPLYEEVDVSDRRHHAEESA